MGKPNFDSDSEEESKKSSSEKPDKNTGHVVNELRKMLSDMNRAQPKSEDNSKSEIPESSPSMDFSSDNAQLSDPDQPREDLPASLEERLGDTAFKPDPSIDAESPLVPPSGSGPSEDMEPPTDSEFWKGNVLGWKEETGSEEPEPKPTPVQPPEPFMEFDPPPESVKEPPSPKSESSPFQNTGSEGMPTEGPPQQPPLEEKSPPDPLPETPLSESKKEEKSEHFDLGELDSLISQGPKSPMDEEEDLQDHPIFEKSESEKKEMDKDVPPGNEKFEESIPIPGNIDTQTKDPAQSKKGIGSKRR